MIDGEASAREYCAKWCNDQAMKRLTRFAELLATENQRQNLVSARSLDDIWLRHFADSIQLLEYCPDPATPLVDLGSGAGFPGIVLSVARPGMRIILIESRRRRTEWLSQVVDELELTSCQVLESRLEAVPSLAAGTITARAFAPLDKLLNVAGRFSTEDTLWLLPKGRSAAQELAMHPTHIQSMFHVKQSHTDPLGGILVGRGVPMA